MTSAGRTRRHTLSRLRDYFLYILIACALIAAGFAVGDKWGSAAFLRWGGLTGFTAVLFALFIGESSQLLREARFWILTTTLLVIHLIAFITLLLLIKEWRLTWFMVMAFEYPVFLYLRSCLPVRKAG
jgi:hypothetical protein